MRLFEAILEANHRACDGDASAGLRIADFPDALPVVALTCIDARLNPLIPEVLGVPEEHFIWLRNAGNIVTGPLSSTLRSLALACAVKSGREIVILGHTDCRVRQTGMAQLLAAFQTLGIERARLPENLVEFFGLFASERQNVLRGVETVRRSPLIGPRIPVHGLLVDIQSGRLEWVVNGYDPLATATATAPTQFAAPPPDPAHSNATAPIGSSGSAQAPLKLPDFKIGEGLGQVQEWLAQAQAKVAELPVGTRFGEGLGRLQAWLGQVEVVETPPAPQPAEPAAPPARAAPPSANPSRPTPLPLPPRLSPKLAFQRQKKR